MQRTDISSRCTSCGFGREKMCVKATDLTEKNMDSSKAQAKYMLFYTSSQDVIFVVVVFRCKRYVY